MKTKWSKIDIFIAACLLIMLVMLFGSVALVVWNWNPNPNSVVQGMT